MHGPVPSNVVLAHGCFDRLHPGHIKHLQEARKLGDRLGVSVTDDKFVRKGPGRPVFTTEQRVESLQALECVDEVIVSNVKVAALDTVKTRMAKADRTGAKTKRKSA